MSRILQIFMVVFLKMFFTILKYSIMKTRKCY